MQLNNLHRTWLNDRGITDTTLELFSIGTTQHPQFPTPCIQIPVHDPDGTFSFNKYRRDPLDEQTPKYLYDQGGRTTLYGAHLIRFDTPIVVTEGELDTLVLHSLNIGAVSSTGGAMSFQENWIHALLHSGLDVYLCYDNDQAGARGMIRTLKYLPQAKIIHIPQQPGVKDISDYVARGGDFHSLMATAMHYPDMASVLKDKNDKASQWQSTVFHNEYIEEHRPKEQTKHTPTKTDDDLQRAKQYPIPEILELKRNTALCPFHNEKTPSLHYYPRTNSTYCFGGCAKAYDVLDIYMKLHNCSLKEAISNINKL